MKALCFAITVFLSLIPATSHAQITNGNFESGEDGWTHEGAVFANAGGNPDGYVHICESGSVSQTVTLIGTASNGCGIAFDVARWVSGCSPQKPSPAEHESWIALVVDGEELWKREATTWTEAGWASINVEVPCGEHNIRLLLRYDVVGVAEVSFDNVRSESVVPVLPATWGLVKMKYR